MSYPGESSIDARVRAVEAEFRRRSSRRLAAFAFIEGTLLALAVIAVYVLELVDDEVGVWIIVAIAVIGALAMSVMLLSLAKARAAAVARATGENPLF